MLSPLRRALLQSERSQSNTGSSSPRPINAAQRIPPLIMPRHSSPEVYQKGSPDHLGSPPRKPLPPTPGSAPSSSPPIRTLMRERLKKTTSDSHINRRIKSEDTPVGNLTPRSRANLLLLCFSKENSKFISKKFVEQLLTREDLRATQIPDC